MSLRKTLHRLSPRRFWREDAAGMTVEAVMIIPLLFWAILATYSYFDVYHVRGLAVKGNFAISDLLSRETNPITPEYLAGIEDVFEYLTQSGDSSWLRVTVVHCDSDCDDPDGRDLDLDWSEATDSHVSLTAQDLNSTYNDVIPLIAFGERVIMVETSLDYNPPFNTVLDGLEPRTMRDVIMTRPRFSGQLAWDDD